MLLQVSMLCSFTNQEQIPGACVLPGSGGHIHDQRLPMQLLLLAARVRRRDIGQPTGLSPISAEKHQRRRLPE